MTNQAAQTMPAVEAAVNAGLASYHGVKTFSSEVRLRSALEATARAMLAAAPAASAKYCSDERPCTPCFSNNGPCEDAPAASGVDTSTNEAWAARAQEKIEAMDAASGGEACGCIYYGLGKAAPYLCEMHKARKADPHPPPAASVSERARELLARAYRVHGHFEYADILLNKPLVGEDYIAAYAIEQALTQQRGEPVAWRFVTENRRHGPQRGHWRDVKDAGMPPQSEDLADGVTVEFAYTTPPAQRRRGAGVAKRG